MTEVLSLALPFFALVLIGFIAGRAGFVSAPGLAGLETFLMSVAMPALFFQFVARTPIAELANWSFLGVTTFATYCAFAIAFSIGAMVNRGNITEATLQGLVGAHANIGYVAPGLALAAFGAAAAAPVALIYTFHTVLVMLLVPVMMGIGGHEVTGARDIAARTAQRIITQPLVLATFLGLLVSAIGVTMPAPVDGLLTLLRQSAAPLALFTLGVTLALLPRASGPFEMPALLVVKLVVHPLIAYLLLSWIGGFDPIWVYTAVLVAALPPATGIYDIARTYGVYTLPSSASVRWGTLAAVVTVTLLLFFIRIGALPADLFR